MSRLYMKGKKTKNTLNQEDMLHVKLDDTGGAALVTALEGVSEAVSADGDKETMEFSGHNNHHDQTASAEPVKNAKERMYDRIPLTYKTVDIICKILVALFIILMIYLVFMGGGRS